MSNAIIRRLFTDQLIYQLTPTTGDMLKYPVQQQGIMNGVDPNTGEQIVIEPDKPHMVVHLMPLPTESDTLGGDHKMYTGIFQITCRASGTGDMNTILEDMTDLIQKAYPINFRFTENNFTVQVISPIKVTEARASRDGSKWWEVHAYFDYRADTN